MSETGQHLSNNDSPPPNGKVPGLHHNRLSWVGTVVSLLALANIIFLFLIGWLANEKSPYLGIFTWVIFPSFLAIGIFVFVLGIVLERRRRVRLGHAEITPYPRIDFNLAKTREMFMVVLVAAAFFIMLSAVGSYEAYEYSDTVQFCGQVCHKVMNPEYTAYLQSPHARVRCVDCHVGPGAGWYVRSKLSGAYQIYSATFNKFPRPIPTPVHNLRPAQETCEQCHWPERFIGSQMKVITHYASDEKNTPRQIRMLIKTGGGSPTSALSEGIHWHMNIANKVTYAYSDDHRQTIPWVKMEDNEGHVTIYKSKSANLSDEQIAKLPTHRMDCIDCHSRPSHIYVPPDKSVDDALLGGKIDPTLPSIKSVAVQALTKEYKTTPEALQGIARDIDDAYKAKPEIYNQRKAAVAQAISATQDIFSKTIFPEMKVDWRTHPNNIGHFYYPGCFRCHDGDHVTADGKVVRKDCDICHAVIEQQEGASNPVKMAGAGFKHPVDIGDLKAVNCTDCHTGGVSP